MVLEIECSLRMFKMIIRLLNNLITNVLVTKPLIIFTHIFQTNIALMKVLKMIAYDSHMSFIHINFFLGKNGFIFGIANLSSSFLFNLASSFELHDLFHIHSYVMLWYILRFNYTGTWPTYSQTK